LLKGKHFFIIARMFILQRMESADTMKSLWLDGLDLVVMKKPETGEEQNCLVLAVTLFYTST